MASVKWVEPVLTWDDQYYMQMNTPRILELKHDDFMPDFLTAMAAAPDKIAQENKKALAFLEQNIALPLANDRLKLYQPLHSRYYLVTASLICEQFGLPDKHVNLKNGESTSFVVRRWLNGKQQAWVENKKWQTLEGDAIDVPHAEEERFPLHPVSVCTGKQSRLEPCQRKLYYGYIATGNREKYVDKREKVDVSSVAEDKMKDFFEGKIGDFFNDANKNIIDETLKFNYALEEFDTKVIASWMYLTRNIDEPNDANEAPPRFGLVDSTWKAHNEASLIVLLEFIDISKRLLPAIYNIIMLNNTAYAAYDGSDLTGAVKELYDFLIKEEIKVNGGNTNLLDALHGLRTFDGLLDDPTRPKPGNAYDISGFTALNLNVPTAPDSTSHLKGLVKAVLKQNPPAAIFKDAEQAEEVFALIQNQVTPTPAENEPAENIYFLRLVYDYDPDCPPVMSEPSKNFTIAPFFDADAPARMVRIEMPSIKLPDLRKFKHGVGFQLSPELRRVMDGVHEGMLDKEGLNDSSGWTIGMVCTFSIQIITLIALVVMFIFAIILNIVFWWLAFLKICLPIPQKN